MANAPGISWGVECQYNAMRTSRGWLLIDFRCRPHVVARISKRRGVLAPSDMYRLGARLNYGPHALTPGMASELDAVA